MLHFQKSWSLGLDAGPDSDDSSEDEPQDPAPVTVLVEPLLL